MSAESSGSQTKNGTFSADRHSARRELCRELCETVMGRVMPHLFSAAAETRTDYREHARIVDVPVVSRGAESVVRLTGHWHVERHQDMYNGGDGSQQLYGTTRGIFRPVSETPGDMFQIDVTPSFEETAPHISLHAPASDEQLAALTEAARLVQLIPSIVEKS